MPILLPPLSRRRFVFGSLAGAASLAMSWSAWAGEDSTDANRFVLFSDTHIAGDPGLVSRGTNMSGNLKQAIGEALEVSPPPAGVFITGDIAYQAGAAEDYANLVKLLKPLRAAGMPIHICLGNHDNRERFWQAIPPGNSPAPVENKHITVVSSPYANWFLLDSLDVTNKAPGVLGEAQLKWLAAALDQNEEKSAIVLVHHNPDFRPKPSALTDTQALLEILVPRKQVKALIYGHSHNWSVSQHDGLQFVNLPPTAYVFGKGKPNGWVDVKTHPNGMTLRLCCLDPQHPQHGEEHQLAWRA